MHIKINTSNPQTQLQGKIRNITKTKKIGKKRALYIPCHYKIRNVGSYMLRRSYATLQKTKPCNVLSYLVSRKDSFLISIQEPLSFLSFTRDISSSQSKTISFGCDQCPRASEKGSCPLLCLSPNANNIHREKIPSWSLQTTIRSPEPQLDTCHATEELPLYF